MQTPLRRLFATALLALSVNILYAQTPFWFDDFETTNSSSNNRVPSNNGGVGGPPYTSYFCRTPATSTVSQAVAFSNFQGSNYWAGEAHITSGTGFAGAGTAAAKEQSITWENIDIAGRTGITFTGAFAANSTNQPFDNQNACSGGATTNTDYLVLQYKIDNGAWISGIRFYSLGPLTGKYLFLETTGDQCGDGAQITNVFQNFSMNIPATGTTMGLRLLAASDQNFEEWGVDNFRLFGASTAPLTWGAVTAKPQRIGVLLNWTTLSESNTKSFAIQYSKDGTNAWQMIGEVPAAGQSGSRKDYSFFHQYAGAGNLYYRIKQVDLDGRSAFSATQAVTAEKTAGAGFAVLSNPVTNQSISLQVYKATTLTLVSEQGQIMLCKNVTEGNVTIPVGNYRRGLYVLRSSDQSERLLIQ